MDIKKPKQFYLKEELVWGRFVSPGVYYQEMDAIDAIDFRQFSDELLAGIIEDKSNSNYLTMVDSMDALTYLMGIIGYDSAN